MKKVSFVFALVVVFTTWAPTRAQTGVTGTWRVEGIGPSFPWEMVLRVDGHKLTGAVSSCVGLRTEIYDGSIDGNTLTFRCKSLASERTITFTGAADGDQITIAREVQGRDAGMSLPPNADGMFGPSAPQKVNMKRTPDAALAEFADHIRGVELAAAVNLLQKSVKVEGALFLPQKIARVRAVIAVVNYGLGKSVFNDPLWQRLSESQETGLLLARITNISTEPIGDIVRQASLGGADGLILLMQRLAQESGHQELESVPFLLWGHSGAGSFAATFAALHPQRTIAFVRYHSAGAGLDDANVKILNQIPALLLSAGNDEPGTAQAAEKFGKIGRSVGASWTFAVESDATHGDEDDLKKANELMIPWITAVLRQRLPPTCTTLRPVTDASGWLGNFQTGDVAPYSKFTGSKADASWLPDEASAEGWRKVQRATK